MYAGGGGFSVGRGAPGAYAPDLTGPGIPLLETMVAQNSLMLQALAMGRSNGDGDRDSGMGGDIFGPVRGSDRLEAYRRELASRPGSVTQEVRTQMALALGSSAEYPQDALEFMRRHTGFATKADLGHCFTLAAQVWNAMEASDWEQAQARTALMMVACDQAARDGRWEVAHLLGRGTAPSHEAMTRRPEKTILVPQTPLARAPWVTAANAYLRETVATEEAFRKFEMGMAGKGKDKAEA